MDFCHFSGEDFYEASPYEPLPPVRHSDAFRLASIISGKHFIKGFFKLLLKLKRLCYY